MNSQDQRRHTTDLPLHTRQRDGLQSIGPFTSHVMKSHHMGLSFPSHVVEVLTHAFESKCEGLGVRGPTRVHVGDVVDHTKVGVAPKDLVIYLKISFHVRGSRHGLIGHPDPPLVSEDPFILLELVLQQCPLHVPYVVSSQHGRSPAELCSSVRVRRPVHHRHGSVHREVQSNQRLTRTRAGSNEGEFPSSELRVELLKYLARVGDWLSRGTLDPC